MTDSLRAVADANIPGIAQAAAALGISAVTVLPSRELTAEAVREADLLFVRSTVRCGPALLGDSRARFVATATIGTDHLDLQWLAQRGIAVASAPGCNASGVAHWLAAALLRLASPGAPLSGPPLDGLLAGVVGVGHVGRLVVPVLEALGAEVLCCDPPRARAESGFAHVPLDELCRRCDVLTLHVPLLRAESDPDRTVGLLDERRLGLMKPGAVLVNAARGEVVEPAALLAALKGPLAAALLDVFPGEPSPPPALVRAALLSTPHIAGHSLEGKVNGTVMVYQAACRFLGVRPVWAPGPDLLPPHPLEGAVVELPAAGTERELLLDLLRGGHDLALDDAALRRIVELPQGERGAAFLRYRETYPARRELRGVGLLVDGGSSWSRRVLLALGAKLR